MARRPERSIRSLRSSQRRNCVPFRSFFLFGTSWSSWIHLHLTLPVLPPGRPKMRCWDVKLGHQWVFVVALEEQDMENLIASLLLVAMPFVPSSFLLLVVRPGAPSGVRSLLIANERDMINLLLDDANLRREETKARAGKRPLRLSILPSL